MKLSIFSLRGVLFEDAVASVNVGTQSGEITVLDHHRPLITLLRPGVAHVVSSDERHHEFPIESGFLEVRGDNSARLLIQ